MNNISCNFLAELSELHFIWMLKKQEEEEKNIACIKDILEALPFPICSFASSPISHCVGAVTMATGHRSDSTVRRHRKNMTDFMGRKSDWMLRTCESCKLRRGH